MKPISFEKFERLLFKLANKFHVRYYLGVKPGYIILDLYPHTEISDLFVQEMKEYGFTLCNEGHSEHSRWVAERSI
jgi:hypothetical protein